MVLTEYTYVFAIGTFFALLDAFNNGANDVANAWVSCCTCTVRLSTLH